MCKQDEERSSSRARSPFEPHSSIIILIIPMFVDVRPPPFVFASNLALAAGCTRATLIREQQHASGSRIDRTRSERYLGNSIESISNAGAALCNFLEGMPWVLLLVIGRLQGRHFYADSIQIAALDDSISQEADYPRDFKRASFLWNILLSTDFEGVCIFCLVAKLIMGNTGLWSFSSLIFDES